MKQRSYNIFSTQLGFWLLCGVLGLFYLFTLKDFRPVLRPDRINFGIDLVGGTYITLEVQTDKAIDAELSDRLQMALKELTQAQRALPISHTVKDHHIYLNFETVADVQEAASVIKGTQPQLITASEGSQLRLKFSENEEARIANWAVQGNIDVLRTRLDDFGVGEIPIAAQGERNIIIELPDVKNPQQAKERIGRTALLEVKLVERAESTKDALLELYDFDLPESLEILPGKGGREFYLVPKYTDLTGRLLKDAYVGFGGDQSASQVVVNFVFKPEGGEKFYELTRSNYGRQIAMIIDGEVISAPKVNGPISDSGYIYGTFTPESAAELSKLLKSGAFVAPVSFIEERQIGPSLGAESIRSGLIACLVGLLLLLVFAVMMYKTAGLWSFIALLYNLFLVMLMLSWLRATLTLPGIAGMVLTVGMAIDASILIYERMKEELAAGAAMSKAVGNGFSDAMQVILDSNITTFLVGIILYQFGTGPIRGFAVTMMVGIISTLITEIFFLRSIFNFSLNNLRMQKIKI